MLFHLYSITKFAGVVLLGSGGFIQPNNVTFLETACKNNEYKTIHPFAFSAYTNAVKGFIHFHKLVGGILKLFFYE